MTENNPVEKTKEVKGGDQRQERTWALFCHLSALLFFVIPPIGHIVGPLVVWHIKKSDMLLVAEEGAKSLNFQISMTIYLFIAFILCFVAIGIPLIFLIGVANIILVIIASIKISNGEKFDYPCTIRFIR